MSDPDTTIYLFGTIHLLPEKFDWRTAELNRDITVFERTAEKSFLAGRLLPTRELYEMILEQNPGHTPSLCKLGIVHLKLNEPEAASDAFRRALELNSNNSYAFRMFGFSLMKLGDIPAAEQAARRSVELAPNDAKNHMLLATLCYRLGRAGVERNDARVGPRALGDVDVQGPGRLGHVDSGGSTRRRLRLRGSATARGAPVCGGPDGSGIRSRALVTFLKAEIQVLSTGQFFLTKFRQRG